jgi:hypothetical protein
LVTTYEKKHSAADKNMLNIEQVRLGIPSDVPAAVQQWNTLIAGLKGNMI